VVALFSAAYFERHGTPPKSGPRRCYTRPARGTRRLVPVRAAVCRGCWASRP